MELRLVKPKGYSGEKATIYTVLNVTDSTNPFSDFFKAWASDHEDKIINFINRIRSMSNITGAKEDFFKLDENEERGKGENVCALYDEPDKEMRLYCIRISEQILIIGSGGPKPPNIHRWQDCPILSKAARYMIFISEIIKVNLAKGTLQYSEDGMHFTGNLNIL